jgi:hypothetical protein
MLPDLDNAKHINELSPEDEFRRQGEEMTVEFDKIVNTYRSPSFPNPHIRQLMHNCWRLVGGKVTPVAICADTLPGIHFYCEVKWPAKKAAIILPRNWLDMLKADPIYQAAGVIYNASKAQDFYNDAFLAMDERAACYEVEFLREIMKLFPQYKLGEYHKNILNKFPLGLGSIPKGLDYEPKKIP